MLNGSKTFISNGQIADLICVVCKTDRNQRARGISLLMLETEGLDGFRRGRNLEKIGMKGQDTSELFFDDVRVPQENLLGGEEGRGSEAGRSSGHRRERGGPWGGAPSPHSGS